MSQSVRRLRAILFPLMAATALAACSSSTTTVSTVSYNPHSPMAQLIDQTRASHGLSPLKRSSTLDAVARRHGEDMARRNYFSHVSADGRRLGDRLRQQGYTTCFGAENIGWGSPYASPAAMVDGWMKSPGHRSAILTRKATEFGFAQVPDQDGTHDNFWVMVFAKPGCVNAATYRP